MKPLRIATRGSRLALAQTRHVMAALQAVCPGLSMDIVEISTKGDRDRSDFLHGRSAVGFFTSEVEKALLTGAADVAVHSLKDLPTAVTTGLAIAAIPPREAVNDVLVTARPVASIADLPSGATVGTSSLRRITQLKRLRGDLDCGPLRGNVETRLRKVRDGQMDAIVVAQAGLNRLGLDDYCGLALEPDVFVPAPGQGALAVQTRADDADLCAMVCRLDDAETRLAVQTERRILAGLHGGCSIPLGVYARIENEMMHIRAVLSSLDTKQFIEKHAACPLDQTQQTAYRLTQQILNEGGREILETLRNDEK